MELREAVFEAEDTNPPIPLLSGNLAIVQNYTQLLVFERGTQGWTQTGAIAMSANSRLAVRVEDGSIYMAPPTRQPGTSPGCIGPYEQWRKVGGTWHVVATIGPQRCRDTECLADINDGRASSSISRGDRRHPPPPDIYAPDGTATWSRIARLLPASIPGQPSYTYYGPGGSIGGNTAFIWNSWLYRNTGGNNWVGPDTLVEPEYELPIYSGTPRLRGSSLILEGHEADYEMPPPGVDGDNLVSGWRALRVYRPRADGPLRILRAVERGFRGAGLERERGWQPRRGCFSELQLRRPGIRATLRLRDTGDGDLPGHAAGHVRER